MRRAGGFSLVSLMIPSADSTGASCMTGLRKKRPKRNILKGEPLMIWNTAGELLELFGVDTSQTGARYFIDVAELLSCTMKFHPVRFHDLLSVQLRELRISPLVFWSLQKRALRPLLEADLSTLKALGCEFDEAPQTVAALVQGVAAAMAARYDDDDADLIQIADGVAALCSGEVQTCG